MDEREILRKWRDLLSGNEAGPELVANAESLLKGLRGDSRLKFRLASELEELKEGPRAAAAAPQA